MEMTPLQDILRYAAQAHGFKYAFAIRMALMTATPDESDVAQFGTFATEGLVELQDELSIKG